MCRFSLFLLVSISFIVYTLCDMPDFTQCLTVGKKPHHKDIVETEDCAYCIEGKPEWPCNVTYDCWCTTESRPYYFDWELNRINIQQALLSELTKFKVGGKFMTVDTVCGIIGNIAAGTAYSFDYTQNTSGTGLFQFDTVMKTAYDAFIKDTAQSDGNEAQVNFVYTIINNSYKWSEKKITLPFNDTELTTLNKIMTDQTKTFNEQADNFAENFKWAATPDKVKRDASARHCAFILRSMTPLVRNGTTTDVSTTTTTIASTTTTPTAHKPSGILFQSGLLTRGSVCLISAIAVAVFF